MFRWNLKCMITGLWCTCPQIWNSRLVHKFWNSKLVHKLWSFCLKKLWSGALPIDNDDANTVNERENKREAMSAEAHYDEFKWATNQDCINFGKLLFFGKSPCCSTFLSKLNYTFIWSNDWNLRKALRL